MHHRNNAPHSVGWVEPDASRGKPITSRPELSHQDDDTFRLPRRDSIARRLIEDWLAGQITL
jgi:hypothetical protein